jgi:hypothetical protein
MSDACDSAGLPHRSFPCNECPIRKDNANNPASKFPTERWQSLTSSVRSPGGFGPDFTSPLFGCHKGQPGQPDQDLACAGWLVKFGDGHPRVRLALAMGQLDPSALQPAPNWPPLHSDWDAVVRDQTLVEGEDDPHE